MIAPGKLTEISKDPKDPNLEKQNNVEQQTLLVWSTQPVFFWKGEMKGIEVRHIRSDKLMWSQNLEPTTNSIIYQGEPLQPGKAYFWREILPDKEALSRRSFRMMKAEDRDRISAELKQLESKLKTEGVSADQIVLRRVEYFADKELWSDVFREIYSVQNPSPKLKELIKQIQGHDFCAPDKGEQQVGLVSEE